METDTLGGRLRQLREAKGVSLDALGREIGMSGQSIWLIETGRTKRIQPETAARLARALNVPEFYLLTGMNPPGEDDLLPSDVLGVYGGLDGYSRHAWVDIGRRLMELQQQYQAGEAQSDDDDAIAAFSDPELAEEMHRDAQADQ